MSGTKDAGCDVLSTDRLDPGRNIVLVPGPNQEFLSPKEQIDYRDYREQFLKWLLREGKNPEEALGYSEYTVYESGYRTAAFDLWTWKRHNEYRIPPKEDDADVYIQDIAFSDRAQSTKGKIEEGLMRYSKWLGHYQGIDEWEFDYTFTSSGGNSHPADFLTVEERHDIRRAALNYGTIPSYHNLRARERERWTEYVAHILEKSTDHVGPDDWDEVDSWKFTSLVWTSLDAGFRPVEVQRANTSWVDTKNEVLRIPKEDSAKNEGNWIVSLTSRTATALDRWLHEREYHEMYEDSDRLWLTRRGNPYASKSLARLLRRLCCDAGIATEYRQMSWYAIRHSVGTYMTKERDLAATKAQLRHKDPKTTMKYDRVPVEDRQDALDRMG